MKKQRLKISLCSSLLGIAEVVSLNTCHWCHVFEKESFEDEEVAELLNKYYISIKVDREERPDIDSVYMSVCQALTGSGGWPLTIIMTPDKKPFFAGTYFPKKSKYGRPGLMDILNQIQEAWAKKRDEIVQSSEEILGAINGVEETYNYEDIGEESIHRAFDEYRFAFDKVYGGFGGVPKFPIPHNISYLLKYYKVYGKDEALKMAEKTLESMYKGGIFDHIGFGFSRYSTDKKWLIPHFEKMLYDNALISYVYVEAYNALGNNFYKEVAEKIFTYVLRDMTSPEGGFYSAEDADSEGEEGKFYIWTEDEIKSVLGEDDGSLFCRYYDIKPHGNFEGKSIPNLIYTDLKEIDKTLKEKLKYLIQKLFQYREKRIHPYKDDKILTSWNGLMIAALAYGGRVLDRGDYIEAAKKSVSFIYYKLMREDGRLMARYREGESAYLGFLDDYAFLVWGLIELYQSTFDVDYLEKAVKLNKDMIDYFWDDKEGGLYIYGKDSEQLISRPKDIYDGAIPSGNSVAAMNMVKLSKITGDSKQDKMVNMLFKLFAGDVKSSPSSYAYFMMALLFSYAPAKEIVIVGEKENKTVKDMISAINKRYVPNSVVILNDGDERLYRLIPYIREQKKIDNKPTVYICENFACHEPITDINKLLEVL